MQTPVVLVLAGGSPRRHRLLAQAGFRFRIVPAEVEEVALAGETPTDMAIRLAHHKAEEVYRRTPTACVLGVDTVVSVDGEMLGKPRDAADADAMLQRLSGRSHKVYSGYAVLSAAGEHRGVEATWVTMRAILPEERARYVATREAIDKAGAYAIQGEPAKFITAVEGSRRNVMGLPIEALIPVLEAFGIRPER